ncbi:hypothetical protein IMSAGC011_03670 [Lachnospiraceae bacterium]|nr:hypothetical protein IMSAGC011_03670 [Lachnospiraceae bacterium]
MICMQALIYKAMDMTHRLSGICLKILTAEHILHWDFTVQVGHIFLHRWYRISGRKKISCG